MATTRSSLQPKWRSAGLDASCELCEREGTMSVDTAESDYAVADAAAEVVFTEFETARGALVAYIDAQTQGIIRSSSTDASEGALQALLNVRNKVTELF